jgi:hypothetical protein
MKVDYSKVADKVKFWRAVIENAKDFTGSSPPGIFVGRAFYPKIYVGILAPPQHQDSAILDFPEKWYEEKASIEQILNYRGQLIYSRFKTSSVKRPSGKLVDVTQELAMARKPADVEIHLKKNPRFTFSFDGFAQPIGNPAPIDSAVLTENPSVEHRVDYIISDQDLKAQNAVVELYQHSIPISRVQKIFSAGLLGLPIQRKFVPTRWGITAVDDILGKILLEKIKDYQELNEIRLFSNTYLGNHFEILLIPGPFRFEMIEAWNLNSVQPSISSDWEDYWGRKDYASHVTGAYYSARLAISEYLDKMKKQASVLVLREIYDEYNIPLGVWVIRETVRDALQNYRIFNSLNEALSTIAQKLKVKPISMFSKSKILKHISFQKSLLSFVKRP